MNFSKMHLISLLLFASNILFNVKLEAKGNLRQRAAVVIDVDIVGRGWVHGVVIGPGERILEWLIVGDERHISAVTALIAAKHVKVCAISLRHGGDEGCFSMAGCSSMQRRHRDTDASQCCKADGFGKCHEIPPRLQTFPQVASRS